MLILNATGKNSSDALKNVGVIDLPSQTRKELSKIYSFDGFIEPPSQEWLSYESDKVANKVSDFVKGMEERTGVQINYVLIDPEPFFAAHLESSIISHGLTPAYAHYRRMKTTEDGKTKTVHVFTGFIVG